MVTVKQNNIPLTAIHTGVVFQILTQKLFVGMTTTHNASDFSLSLVRAVFVPLTFTVIDALATLALSDPFLLIPKSKVSEKFGYGAARTDLCFHTFT
jgi:hypothetical protein